jgi:hypothetical protein
MKKIVDLFLIFSLSFVTLSNVGCSAPPTDKKFVKPVPIPDDVSPDELKKQQEENFDDDEEEQDESDKKLTCQERFSKCMDECKDIESIDDGSIDWEKKMCINSCKIKYNFCSFLDFF